LKDFFPKPAIGVAAGAGKLRQRGNRTIFGTIRDRWEQIIDKSGVKAVILLTLAAYTAIIPQLYKFRIGFILSNFNRNRGNNGITQNNDCGRR